MNKLIIPIGIPGSGKSTLSSRFKNIEIISSDEIREEFFGDANLQYTDEFAMKRIKSKGIDISNLDDEKLEKLKIQVCNASVFGTVNYRVKKALEEGKDVFYDATNISSKGRKRILKQFKGLYDKAIAYYFEIPLETVLKRNKGRKRVVPDEVIYNMLENLEYPSKKEGFDEIHIIKE